MRLKHYFYILAAVLFTTWGLMVYQSAVQQDKLIYAACTLLSFCLVYLAYLYRKIINPLNKIANGMDLLQAQDFSSRLTPVGQQEADHIITVFNRMMSQLKEERLRLREQNHFLDLLLNVSPMGIIIPTIDGKISMINKAALQFLAEGTEEEILHKPLTDLQGDLAQELQRIPRDTASTVRLSDSHIYRCSHLSFIDHGFALPFYLIESLTSEIMKAEKKAYEKVIRIIAHEVNNSVAGITSTLDTVSDSLESLDETDAIREMMHMCIERCYSMSRFITNFADVVKIPEPQCRKVHLNDSVTACKLFMESTCQNRDITVEMNLCKENPIVLIDTVLFEQVLINVIKNAAESISDQGHITIRTLAQPLMLQVEDNGKGISREIEEKLFTPFFSTKPNGQGIGLVFIREVLMKHGCTFSLRTYPDGITRFRINFTSPCTK